VKRLPYKEGDWFTAPLRPGGYAVGRVARMAPGGKIILAYFFGPAHESAPGISDVASLRPQEAILKVRVGDLGFVERSWLVIGTTDWRREDWPVPAFVRRDDLSRSAWAVTYADSDPNTVVSEQRVPYTEGTFDRDAVYGAGAAEILLSRLLHAAVPP
jgi:hypothetical protein